MGDSRRFSASAGYGSRRSPATVLVNWPMASKESSNASTAPASIPDMSVTVRHRVLGEAYDLLSRRALRLIDSRPIDLRRISRCAWRLRVSGFRRFRTLFGAEGG